VIVHCGCTTRERCRSPRPESGRSAQLVRHPEAGDHAAEDSDDTQREDRCEAAVELGDFPARIVAQEHDIGHAGQEYPSDDVENVVLLGVQSGDSDERGTERRGDSNAAVHKAAGPGKPVTQEIALSVKGDKVECTVNGTVVGSYDKSAVVTAGRLKSTDGVYGIRFAHNTEGFVTALALARP